MNNNTKKWYAIYTKPRWEKKVYALLQEQEIAAYCPLNKVRKKWSDRYKIVHEPLFKSYVFVQVEENEMTKVRMVGGVVNFVYWNGKPAIIKDEEIHIIRKFLNEHEHVEAEPLQFMPNQRVKIMSGVLMDKEGIVIRSDKNKVQVVLESLGFRLTARLSSNEIRPV
ncbi:UpxY family transcription antiterminator [Agriterribacter sp.]|uniref:transcription termination/antitermination protein NusG n=1 Tax=Agriterribacter sp. TaxID=2821509 RepID=UPI002CCCD99C|nr:UpxY family transcription antiterminator [Agriterribacter sp.]HTN06092.1 UpxY family transcription antiterminator [Agriterribacter sp.]